MLGFGISGAESSVPVNSVREYQLSINFIFHYLPIQNSLKA